MQTQNGTIVPWQQANTDSVQDQIASLGTALVQETINKPPTWLFYPTNRDGRNRRRVLGPYVGTADISLNRVYLLSTV